MKVIIFYMQMKEIVFVFYTIHVHLLASKVGEEELGRNSKVRVWEVLRALQS